MVSHRETSVRGRGHRCVRTRPGSERGAAAVEFAVVAPLLMLLVFAIIDFGFGFHAWDAAQNAAREGARVGAVSTDVNEIAARVRSSTSFLDQTKVTVTVQCARAGSSVFSTCGPGSTWLEGDIVRVTVVYRYAYMTPLPTMVGLGSTLAATAVAESRFEGQ